jgi:hypothetical protein
MANTFKKIQTVTVGSGGASSIDFTSIPQTFTDLKIVVSARSSRSAVSDWTSIQFNSNTSNYSMRVLAGSGTLAESATDTSIYLPCAGNTATASIFGNSEYYIPNYTSANNKSVSGDGINENNATAAVSYLIAGLWSNTAAITSIKLQMLTSGQTFSQYSTATLYGVSNVPAAGNAKATGGIITYDDTYVYHTFPWSGTFTPLTSLTADYLVVAGAGGGGGPGVGGGGGGGAGGVRCTVGATGGGGSLESALSLTAQAYTVTVGAGGAANTAGNNSVFSTITSTAGGRGKDSSTGANSTGGSGGGGNGTIGGGGAGNTTGAAGTANQGYAGGNGFPGTSDTVRNSGGGGGAGSVGGNADASVAGNGGSGITTSISGTSTVYAGGGGGGVGYGTRGTGTDGGGNGGNGSTAGVSGTANRGAGGGGGGRNESTGTTQSPGAGGSGIVIVRYAK